MTEPTALPPSAQRYLEQLRHESAALPAAARQQLLGQISEHLTESIDDGSEPEAVLRRLGSARELVAAAGAEEAERALPPWRPSGLLWLALAGIVVGVLLLAMGGGTFLTTGRGRGLLWLAAPGLVLAAAGVVLLLRELRASRADPAAAAPRQRLVRWLACAAIAAGALLLILSSSMMVITGRGRSVLLAIPGILLAVVGLIALVRHTSRSGRASV